MHHVRALGWVFFTFFGVCLSWRYLKLWLFIQENEEEKLDPSSLKFIVNLSSGCIIGSCLNNILMDFNMTLVPNIFNKFFSGLILMYLVYLYEERIKEKVK